MKEKIITVSALQEKLTRKEPVFILDVRPSDQRSEWHINGSAHIDAYKQLKAGDNSVLDAVDIPANSTVVTVCAAGKTSLIAARALQNRGVDVYSLEGGMKAWNYAWDVAEVQLADGTTILQVRRPAKGIFSYLVASGGEAVVIDAALEPDVYLALARKNKCVIKYVTDTHIHADFVSRGRELAASSGASYMMIDKADVDFEFVSVPPGYVLNFGDAELEFIHTPGHTWESTSLKLGESALFTGDTLFVDGIGRPDLKAEKDEAIARARGLYHSVKTIFDMNPSLLVLPAHSSGSIPFNSPLVAASVGEIRPRLSIMESDEQTFVDHTISRIPPTPPNYLSIATLNRSGSHEGAVLADLEAGGNHCAIATN